MVCGIQKFKPFPLLFESSDSGIFNTVVNGQVVSQFFSIRKLAQGLRFRKFYEATWILTVAVNRPRRCQNLAYTESGLQPMWGLARYGVQLIFRF